MTSSARFDTRLSLTLFGLMLAWLCIEAIDVTRPKAEPRPTAPYELNEFKVTRHEHA
ncbi:hypothetical protein [Guyparkeria halopsychrophila]|uniref:hypothetical protein n=1 Tax=Guyparkeria halopsychrophila TaxID=3139421 RepID=UPI0037C9FDA8